MTATIIDGKAFAAQLQSKLADHVAMLKDRQGLRPGLTVVMIGDHPASMVYVRNKAKQAKEVGIRSDQIDLPATVSERKVMTVIRRLNTDPTVHGILVQLPLPDAINENSVLDAVAPEKDVDGFHVINTGRLSVGMQAMVPCTPLGCLMLLKNQIGDLTGRRALIIGRSNIVGKPMAQLLLRENCTVTVAHSRTRDLSIECRRADIIIAAVGKPELVRGDWVQPGATVIDVGINRVNTENGKTRLVGDVAFNEVREVAGAITPVPGGVGPMTIAVLMANTVLAACRAAGIEPPEELVY